MNAHSSFPLCLNKRILNLIQNYISENNYQYCLGERKGKNILKNRTITNMNNIKQEIHAILWRPKNLSLFPHRPKVRVLEITSSFFKVIVYLPQKKVPPRFRSESSVLSRLLSTCVVNSQTLYFKYREEDMFLP